MKHNAKQIDIATAKTERPDRRSNSERMHSKHGWVMLLK